MMRLAACLFLAALAPGLAATAVRAQDASVPSSAGSAISAPSAATAAKPATGSFEMLPPGERKIARALFLAQHPSAKGPAPLSLNQIADLKREGGWGKVFKRMQAEGLIQAKTLGQVVSGYERQLHSEATGRQRPHTILVTNAQGGVSGSSRNRGVDHGGDKISSDRNVAVAVAADGAPSSGHSPRPVLRASAERRPRRLRPERRPMLAVCAFVSFSMLLRVDAS